MQVKNIYLIIGKSGAGKTTIADILETKYHLKQIQSYTTRPPRYDGERGHIFVTKKDFTNEMISNCVAFTTYLDNYYWATKQQVDKCAIYVIDPIGVDFFKERYDGKKKIITFVITANNDVRIKRMRARGDSESTIASRLKYDVGAFSNFVGDYTFVNNDDSFGAIDKLVEEIVETIKKIEGKE